MNPIQQKSALRRQALARRDDLSPEFRIQSSELIARRAMELLLMESVKRVHCYLDFRSEVDTSSLIAMMRATQIKVVVPVIDEDESMAHAEYTEKDLLVERTFGIREPAELRAVTDLKFDAVFIPLLAFDRSGARLGYGKGYYDRFLKLLRKETLRVGLAFAAQELPNIPRDEHDELLQYVVTESEVIQCGQSSEESKH